MTISNNQNIINYYKLFSLGFEKLTHPTRQFFSKNLLTTMSTTINVVTPIWDHLQNTFATYLQREQLVDPSADVTKAQRSSEILSDEELLALTSDLAIPLNISQTPRHIQQLTKLIENHTKIMHTWSLPIVVQENPDAGLLLQDNPAITNHCEAALDAQQLLQETFSQLQVLSTSSCIAIPQGMLQIYPALQTDFFEPNANIFEILSTSLLTLTTIKIKLGYYTSRE